MDSNSFEGFLAECRTHYRLVPLLAMIEKDQQEFVRLRDAFFVCNRLELIKELYQWVESKTPPSYQSLPSSL